MFADAVPMCLAMFDQAQIQLWLQHAFYPALYLVFLIASLGLPIPEDVPLIAAGVILRTSPATANWVGAYVGLDPVVAGWTATLLVSFVGIMSGDVVLYTMGRRFGRHVFEHRWVSWLMTPQRFEWLCDRFSRYGSWMCFFGRFFMGIRAAMCLTAGVTRFPFFRFFLADAAGAVLSIPFFVILGYAFAHMLSELQGVLINAQWVIGAIVVLAIAGFIWWEVRRHRRSRDPKPPLGSGGEAPAARSAPTPAPSASRPPAAPTAAHPEP